VTVVGVILNLALWFALHVVFREVGSLQAWGLSLAVPDPVSIDPVAAVLAAVALVAAFRFKIGLGPLLAGAAAVGLGLFAIGVVSP
jgi:chromate transporter